MPIWFKPTRLRRVQICRFGSNQVACGRHATQKAGIRHAACKGFEEVHPVPQSTAHGQDEGAERQNAATEPTDQVHQEQGRYLSAASDIVEKISSRDLILRKADQKKIVKMGQKADLIIKTIDDYKAKIDYINSGQAAIDEWKKQRAAEGQQEREEKENQEAASRGEAPPARKRPAGATDYPLAAGYVPKYLREKAD